MENESINKEIISIWEKYPEKIRGENLPLVYPFFNKGELLFIGCNPSLRKNSKEDFKFNLSKIDNLLKFEKQNQLYQLQQKLLVFKQQFQERETSEK